MHGGGNTYITIKQRERELEKKRRKRSKKYRATAAAAKNNPKREPHGLLCILLGGERRRRKLKLSPRPGETRQGPANAGKKRETTPNMTLQLLSSNTYTSTSAGEKEKYCEV